jgi:hypothetical protein
VKTSGASGGKCEYRRPVISAAARIRAKGEDFSASFAELQNVVQQACARRSEWEAKVVAGIRAIVDFAAANPAKARALTVEARRPKSGEPESAQEVVEYFADLLGEVAPAEKRFPISTDASVVEAIATIVRGHLLAGTADRLPDAAPDLVYLALMPYLGIAETRGWAMALSLDTG